MVGLMELPAVAVVGCVVYTNLLAVPAVPVAVKVAVRVPLLIEAVKVLVPAVVPKVQLVTAAIPLALVVTEVGVTVPPPPATANVTETPDTGLLLASLTITLGAVLTAAPAMAV